MASPIDAFYPTPKNLIDKMVSGVDFKLVGSVLEPSAGKGDIVDVVADRLRMYHGRSYNYDSRSPYQPDIDTIEINPDLRHVLAGKGYRVVHGDFLTYETYKHYHLIVMNPPFAQGEKHLLKALEMQERGGAIICILNAETIRNPNNLTRVTVNGLLDQYGASIEYLSDEFRQAERKTAVEIALVKVDIPAADEESIIINSLKKANEVKVISPGECTDLSEADYVKATITQFKLEAKAGLQLIWDYKAMKPYLALSKGVLSLCFSNDYSSVHECPNENEYLKRIRAKYWNTLFLSDQFKKQFTCNLLDMCRRDVERLEDYDFNEFNIAEIRISLINKLTKATEDTIVKLFDDLSNKHHYYDETSKNIHYYNGWKTNKAWIINKKVIIPCSLWNALFELFYTDHGPYDPRNYLADIEKTLNYLSNKPKPEVSVYEVIEEAKKNRQTKDIDTHYFTMTCYKKGTVHLTFKDEELLKKFNIFGAQHKGWLPPSYGKVNYDNLEREERAVVDSFEGEESYTETMSNAGYYLSGVSLLEVGR